MLIQIKKRIIQSLEVYLKFDDGTEKTVVLNEGDHKIVTYVANKELVTISGIIKHIICPLNRDDEVIIIMDCSDKYNSDLVRFSADLIRNIEDIEELPEEITDDTL